MSLRNLLHPVLPSLDGNNFGGNEIEILQEIPVETLFLALKECDTDTSLWFFQNSRPEQIQGLIDLDCWNGDQFLPERFDPYFRTMSLLSPLKLKEYMKWIDPEVIVRGLMEYADVLDFDPQNPPDYPESQILITLDSKYVLLLKTENPEIREALYTWINKFSAADLPLLHRHLESCKWEQKSDLEEFAYKIKKGRLEDMGFVDREEAISLYAVGSAPDLRKHILENPLPQNTKREAAQSHKAQTEGEDSQDFVFDFLPDIIREQTSEETFFGDAFIGLDSKPLRDLVMMELVRCINAVLTADDMLHQDLSQIQDQVQRSRELLNIGLGYLSDQKITQATKILENTPITSIFRVGWLVVYDLTKVATQIKKNLGSEFWPTLDKEFLESLQGRHPQLPPHLMIDLGAPAGVNFLKLETLYLAAKRLKQLAELSDFFFQKMSSAVRIAEKSESPSDNLYSRIITGLYREASQAEFKTESLTLEEWTTCSHLFSEERFQRSLHITASQAPEGSKGLFEKRLGDYAEECVLLVRKFKEKSMLPQPRFVRCLILK